MKQEGLNQTAYDVVVIGSGSAGLAAAYGIAQANYRVALVERDSFLGGECPNYACIPAKALLRSAKIYQLTKAAHRFGLKISDANFDYKLIRAYKESTVAKTGGRNLDAQKLADQGITLIRGEAVFIDQHTLMVGHLTVPGRQFVIATGSSTNIPAIEGLNTTPYLTSKTAMELNQLPESIIILGAGPVGVEFAQLFSSFSVDVTLIQQSEWILPREDVEISELVANNLKDRGVAIITNFDTEKIWGDRSLVGISGHSKNSRDEFSASKILIATSKKPNTANLNLDKIGVRLGPQGIETDSWLRTSIPHIWAAGDVRGQMLFTHTSHYEGTLVAHNIINPNKRSVDLAVVPRVTFTDPETASVGLTAQQLMLTDRSIVIGRSNIASLGRALTDGETTGMVKIIADESTGMVLGASIVAERAGEMIHELALAMKARIPVDTIADTIHAFPTYSEAVAVACQDAVIRRKKNQKINQSDLSPTVINRFNQKAYRIISWSTQ